MDFYLVIRVISIPISGIMSFVIVLTAWKLSWISLLRSAIFEVATNSGSHVKDLLCTEDVLDCYWKDSISDYKCITILPQFRFSGSIATNLTLELPQAREEDEGDYSCVTLPENTSANPCSFLLLSKLCKM